MYPLLRDTYGIIGEHAQLLSPTSQRWVGFAKVVTQRARRAAARSGRRRCAVRVDEGCRSSGERSVGVLLTVLEQRKEWRGFIPSPTGMGIAMLIPFNAVTVIFLGSMVDAAWARVAPRSPRAVLDPLASGLIAGEALVAVVIPLLVTLGVLKL